MLDAYGLHELVWDACDERFSDMLVASPADAGGRGISLAVREGGAAADMTGATVYLAWKHKAAGSRGTEPFQAVNASAGTFTVFYPAAMCEAAGAVQAQIVVSRGDDTYISSRVFTVKVEPVVIGGEESEDGFTLFIGAINAYENATEITTDAATAANAAATLANTAAGNADQAVADLQAAAQRGDFDGADGQDGADGFSPTATVTQTAFGATITITDKNGTTTADIAKGAQGEKEHHGRDRAEGRCRRHRAEGRHRCSRGRRQRRRLLHAQLERHGANRHERIRDELRRSRGPAGAGRRDRARGSRRHDLHPADPDLAFKRRAVDRPIRLPGGLGPAVETLGGRRYNEHGRERGRVG